MWDDDELRAEMLAELDTAPPAAGGGLGEVVRRGQRRRRIRQAGTALAVVALLTATGAAAGALGGDPLPPATSAPPSEAPWPHADLPGHQPTGVWHGGETSPNGDVVARHSLCDIPDVVHDRLDVYRATAAQWAKMEATLRAASPELTVSLLVERHLRPDRPEQRERWVYEIDVSDRDGTGSLRFEIGDYTGTPLAAADAQAFDVGNCAPPKRHVLPDGTVLQLYETRPTEPLAQVLRIFLPDGRLYQVTVRSWGSPDLGTNPDRPGSPSRTGTSRETLPLTEYQLAELGLGLVRTR